MSRRPALVTQAQIRRAAAAAKQEGLAVEVMPDGRIRLIPIIPPQGSGDVQAGPEKVIAL